MIYGRLHGAFFTKEKMAKTELLAALNAIEGDPQIIIWNGHVGDYQNIASVTPLMLTKPTLSEWVFRLVCERVVDTGDRNYALPPGELKEWEETLREKDWEIDNYVSEIDIAEGRYVEKAVYILEPTARGIETFDRLGNIEY